MKLLASVADVWQDQTVMIAGTTAGLAALTVPVNTVAYNTQTGTLQRSTGGAGAFTSCSLSNPASVQAGLPAGPHFLGQLTYNLTTQALLVCTAADPVLGTWDTVFVAPQAAGAPPAEAALVLGGAYFDTTLNRLAFYDGAAWVNLPVMSYATTAAITALRGAIATAGQYAWNTDTNRLSVFTGAAFYNDTTIGMYAPAVAHEINGALIMDPTGFGVTAPNFGTLRVYDSSAPAGWILPSVVVVGYAGVPGAPGVGPLAGDVPNGTLAIDTTGGANARLYAHIGGAWVTAL
jgi:hypothetical protein